MFKSLFILAHYLKTRHGYHFASRHALENHQKRKIKQFTKNIVPRSAFYQGMKNKSLQDFAVMDKPLMMQHFNDINTVGIDKDEAMKLAISAEESRDFSPELHGCSVGLSTGTSGMQGLFLVSAKERMRWAGIMLARMLPAPIWHPHKIAFFLRANNNLYDSVSGQGRIQFEFFDLIKPLDSHFQKLQKMSPTLLIAPAQVLRLLALAQLEGKLSLAPQRVISVAETLFDDDREIIERAFAQKVHQIYQCTEGFLGYSCAHGQLHLNETFVHIEPDWVDKEKGRFAPIITDFTRTSQLFIRYRLDDILTLDPKPCPCGNHERVITRIEGRADDILTFHTNKNHQLYQLMPDYITRALAGAGGTIEDFHLEQKHDGSLVVFLKAKQQKAAQHHALTALTALFAKHDLIFPSIDFAPLPAIDLMTKRRRVMKRKT